MNYYPFHLGDYAAHTAHLEPLEDLAYRRMLDAYYLREAPLPADPAEVARLIRMRQNMAEVEAVLREFFQLTDDGWTHARCDEEIDRMQDKQAKARASAAASVNVRRAKAQPALNDGTAAAGRTFSDRSTDVELPTPTPTPTPTPNNPPTPKGEFERFWKAYPRKVGKDAAQRAFDKLRPTAALVDDMVAAIERQCRSDAWTKDGGQFIPHPTTWLNQGRWNDEPPVIHIPTPIDRGPDPELERIKRDAQQATPMPSFVKELAAQLTGKAH